MYVFIKITSEHGFTVLGPFYSEENALNWLEEAEPDNEQDELDSNRYLCYEHYYSLHKVESPNK